MRTACLLFTAAVLAAFADGAAAQSYSSGSRYGAAVGQPGSGVRIPQTSPQGTGARTGTEVGNRNTDVGTPATHLRRGVGGSSTTGTGVSTRSMPNVEVFDADADAVDRRIPVWLIAKGDDGRMRWHDGRWWYYHPNNTWSYWDNSGWQPHGSGVTVVTPGFSANFGSTYSYPYSYPYSSSYGSYGNYGYGSGYGSGYGYGYGSGYGTGHHLHGHGWGGHGPGWNSGWNSGPGISIGTGRGTGFRIGF